MFTPQIHAAAQGKHVNMRAMILLGINGGLGNTDIGTLTLEALDSTGWLDTRADHSATDSALGGNRAALDQCWLHDGGRRTATRSCCSSGPEEQRWAHRLSGSSRISARVPQGRSRAARSTPCARHSRQSPRNPATWSRSRASWGTPPAASDMSSIYRQRLTERLRKVVQVVHDWLYAPPKADDERATFSRFAVG